MAIKTGARLIKASTDRLQLYVDKLVQASKADLAMNNDSLK